jgi:hypothetical protein
VIVPVIVVGWNCSLILGTSIDGDETWRVFLYTKMRFSSHRRCHDKPNWCNGAGNFHPDHKSDMVWMG